MNSVTILQLVTKYTNALYNDGSLYWSGDESLSTPERKALVVSDIKLISDNLAILSKELS